MERWDFKSLPKNRHNKHSRENPSFSSTLLDSIYRSIDGPHHLEEPSRREQEQHHLVFYKETTMKNKQSTTTTTTSGRHGHGLFKDDQEHEIMSLRRACLIEKWMEKKAGENSVPVRRNSIADFDTKKSRYIHNELLINSSSSSSDSSYGGGFSSSESESMYGSKSRSSSSCYSMQRPKPIRTSISSEKVGFDERKHHNSQKTKHENSFVKTKSKALKIYGDLKKVKQPISPGGKLASFLNSLFNAGNVKKHKVGDLRGERKPSYDLGVERNLSSKSGQQGHSYSNTSSTCSSASSFSRSCLRKAPLSRSDLSGVSSNGDMTKRSVRFCPVSVIVDEDCRPCGEKTVLEAQPGLMAAAKAIKPPTNEDLGGQYCVMEVDDEDDHRRIVEEVARDYLRKNYQKKNDEVEDDDDDDAESYASSDLFELDTAGVEERYRQELPVYETTFFDRNRAILMV